VSVVVSRDGKNVYAASEGSSAVAAFARDRKTGSLVQLAGLGGFINEDGTLGACGDGKGADSDEAEHLVRGKPISRSERSRSPGPSDGEHRPGRSVATLVRFSSPMPTPRSRSIGSSSWILPSM
jgi:hypothetical protein